MNWHQKNQNLLWLTTISGYSMALPSVKAPGIAQVFSKVEPGFEANVMPPIPAMKSPALTGKFRVSDIVNFLFDHGVKEVKVFQESIIASFDGFWDEGDNLGLGIQLCGLTHFEAYCYESYAGSGIQQSMLFHDLKSCWDWALLNCLCAETQLTLNLD